MKRLAILLILALVLISISAVSASENATDLQTVDSCVDVISDDVIQETSVEEVVSNSTISANPTTGYEQFSTKFTVTLKSNGTYLNSKPVIINVDGNNYSRTTNDLGQAILKIKLAKGTYAAKYYFLGDNVTNPSNGSAKLTIKSPTKTTLTVYDKNINYRQGSKSIFSVRLMTSQGKAVKGQQVIFKYNGISKTAKTDNNGIASIFIKLNKGKYKISFAFKSNCPYLSSSGSHKISVKPYMGKGYAYWVWGDTMKLVNLKALKSKGTKHIFLNSYAFKMYGTNDVKSWISSANRYGMQVHIWIQVFYEGKWVRPVNDDGSFKYSYMKQKINEAKKCAKIKGVSGIHFDYVRFGGTAYKYDTSSQAISYFIKKVCLEVRKIKPNAILSAAVMPEPGMMDYYYGQDIPTISKYLDVICPMAYKGNYGKTTSWIKYVTKAMVADSNSAQVWTGIQTYKSDSNPVKLSYSKLLKDAKAAKNGGAKGVILFRWGISKLLDFNKV